MKVRFSPRARADIDDILRYIEARSPSGARNVASGLYAAIGFIAERPEAAQRTDNPRVRVRLVRRYPYRIFYSIETDAVVLLHIRHTARRPWSGN
jgi:plasmid stabilization system protein ParE